MILYHITTTSSESREWRVQDCIREGELAPSVTSSVDGWSDETRTLSYRDVAPNSSSGLYFRRHRDLSFFTEETKRKEHFCSASSHFDWRSLSVDRIGNRIGLHPFRLLFLFVKKVWKAWWPCHSRPCWHSCQQVARCNPCCHPCRYPVPRWCHVNLVVVGCHHHNVTRWIIVFFHHQRPWQLRVVAF